MNLWPGQQMITLADFERVAQVSRRVSYGMIERGEIAAAKVGKYWRIPRREAFRVLRLEDPEPGVPVVEAAPPETSVRAGPSLLTPSDLASLRKATRR